MRCPHCNTLIESGSRCPLCGAPIEADPLAPVAYAPHKKKIKAYKIPFTFYYVLLSIAVTVACAVVNLFHRPSLPWWIASAVSLAMLYFFIRHTLLGIRNMASKLVYLAVATLIFINGLCAVFQWEIGFAYVSPLVMLLFAAAVYFYVFFTFRRSRGHLLSPVFASLVLIVPFIAALNKGVDPLCSLVVACVGMLVTLVTICLFPREIGSEIKRFFAS